MGLHCESHGQGPDLVMLHGWGLDSGIWAPWLDSLTERFRVHLIDLPGHGRSPALEPYTLAAIADELAATIETPAAWLGWSMGGLCAIEVAARYPRRVRRLALLASNPRFTRRADDFPGLEPAVLEGFAADLARNHSATVQRFLSLVARGAPDAQVLRTLRRRQSTAPAPAAAALNGGLQLLRSVDLRAAVGGLSMPVCLLGGVRDSLVPIAALRRLRTDYPHIPLIEIEAAGHAPFLSHPQRTARDLLEFLA